MYLIVHCINASHMSIFCMLCMRLSIILPMRGLTCIVINKVLLCFVLIWIGIEIKKHLSLKVCH